MGKIFKSVFTVNEPHPDTGMFPSGDDGQGYREPPMILPTMTFNNENESEQQVDENDIFGGVSLNGGVLPLPVMTFNRRSKAKPTEQPTVNRGQEDMLIMPEFRYE